MPKRPTKNELLEWKEDPITKWFIESVQEYDLYLMKECRKGVFDSEQKEGQFYAIDKILECIEEQSRFKT